MRPRPAFPGMTRDSNFCAVTHEALDQVRGQDNASVMSVAVGNRRFRVRKTVMLKFTTLVLAIAAPTLAFAQRPVPGGFSELADRLSPAVVNISTAQTVEIQDDLPKYPEGSPLERFNDFFGRGRGGSSVSKALGSGFVIDADGHIVTNNHVIEEADLIEVTFPDGETFQAELLGRDRDTDLALLKIEDDEAFPFVRWADSDATEVGEWVMAIGNPFGYASSVSAGIVSAKARDIGNSAYDDFIQTDVAINQGNSGGPLFNMDGDVVGVNTAILSPTGYSVGISFSIPAELAESTVNQLKEFGETRRATIKVRLKAVDRDLAQAYGLDTPKGAIIRDVISGGPADEAGLRRGDLIVGVGGREVDDTRALFRAVADAAVGEPLLIEIIRKRKRQTINVTPEAREDTVTDEEKARRRDSEANADRVAGGLSVEALTDEVRSRYRLADRVKGVRVSKVDRRSPLSGKILEGDIIEQIDFKDITSPEAFESAVEEAEGLDRAVQVLINRSGDYVIYAAQL